MAKDSKRDPMTPDEFSHRFSNRKTPAFDVRAGHLDVDELYAEANRARDAETALRADLDKAKEEIDLLAEERDSEADEHRCAEVECSELRAQLAKAKERDEWHTERLRGLALAGENLAKATPDRVLRMELERFVRLAKEAPP